MSRFKRFAHSLASGYVLLGANMFYTLASIPLALKYLTPSEFGLWGLATNIGSFIALVDFGLGASVARILVDHKDERVSGNYGSLIKTGFLVGLSQGVAILLVGIILACFIGPWLGVRDSLQPTLRWLMIGQCAVMALSFSTRTFAHVLTAHQRYDINNYAQSLLFGVAFGISWFAFRHGQGVFSILWGYAITTLPVVLVNWISCVRLKFLPQRGEWGPVTWAGFKNVFAFGNDIFIFALGAQLINASQTLLLTRFIGLEAVAVWTVFTRIYQVLQQIIYRFFDYSSSAFAEMMVRGEKTLLAARFRQIVILSLSLSVVAGTLFAICNRPFVTLWTSGRFESPMLTASDLKAPKLFAERLVAQRDPVTQFLWQQFTPGSRVELAKLAREEEMKPQLLSVLVTELNHLIQGKARLAHTNFSLVTPTTLPSPDPGNQQAGAWSNRHVLEDAFPKEVADSRKARWSPWNDLLLAVWLVLCVSLHANVGLVGQAKAFGFLRYLFFLEGLTFVGLTILLIPYGGITAMLCTSVLCSLTFSFAYGLWRTQKYFNLTVPELAAWHHAPLKLVLWLVPVAGLVAWLTHTLSPTLQFAINASVVGLWATLGLLRHGLDTVLQRELLRRAPSPVKGLLSRLISRSPNDG